MPALKIDHKLCKKDGLCVRICQKVFYQRDRDSVPEVAHEEFCNRCGHCILICPSGAISHKDYTQGHIHPVQKRLIPSYEQIYEMITTRRSIRTFQKRPVEKEIIEKIIDCARYAPSAKNTQSTQYIVVQEKSSIRTIASATADFLVGRRLNNPVIKRLYALRGAGSPEELSQMAERFMFLAESMRKDIDLVLFETPVLILFHADSRIRFASENANLACQNATLAACSLGIGCFYTGYVVTACSHDKKLKRFLGLPERHRIYAGLALGYPLIQFTKWIERNPARVKWM